MKTKKTHYESLGISRNATDDEIRKSYLRLAKECHPDRRGPEGKRRFQEIQSAYETLSRPEMRSQYDASILRRSPKKKRHSVPRVHPQPEPTVKNAPEPLIPQNRLDPKITKRDRSGHGEAIRLPSWFARQGGEMVVRVPVRRERDSGWGALEVFTRIEEFSIRIDGPVENGDRIRVLIPESGLEVFNLIVIIDD